MNSFRTNAIISSKHSPRFSVVFENRVTRRQVIIISAKWTEWTGEISCDAFFPSVRIQYLDANISKTVWVRDLVPVTH